MKRIELLLTVCLVFIGHVGHSQTTLVRECKQRAFSKTVSAGNYSGITHIDGNKYALVSDKSENDGFYIFSIVIDTLTGAIADVKEIEFLGDSVCGGDCEGIVFRPSSSTFYICREKDSSIVEYGNDGKLTGKALSVPDIYKNITGNFGLESLTYDEHKHLFWTINESTLPCDGAQATSTNGVKNMLRLQSFTDDLRPCAQYAYMMDAPKADSRSSKYAMGVSEITALGDGALLVLEREFFVPRNKLGAFVQCKLYEVEPSKEFEVNDEMQIDETICLPKHFICSFITKLKLFDWSLANYEGMCLGPTLADGSKVIILVSDSQNRHGGILKDWFKTIVVK